ncbi:hypothetical protein [Kitasatospora sp. GP82]|uniref:hypothetical protein n=1 Tax=Kitasatospora sp. GP82 TaxID=3035089 RepID=UPI002475253A|nr:hypothetical protein [Kitasatospora sp. GP82]MDH6123735.1 hypothetical protein [Kitasatospora sp. GP82]
MSVKRTFLVSVALLALAGCASGTPSVAPPMTLAPTPVVLDETADRTTVRVAVGTGVRIDLHSTYWSAVTSSAPTVLRPSGAASTQAVPSCRPGSGCGAVTSDFVAAEAGSAVLTAQRTSCGEALACPPDSRSFTVTVQVTR